jgi:hypothetical protein
LTLPVVLSSSGTAAVTINAITLNGSGFSVSGATTPLTLNPAQTATLNVKFNPTAAGAVTGSLVINSTSSGNPSVTLSLSATGVAASVSHEIDLTWDAPVDSPVAVTGYNIYRATGSSTTFQLVNASAVAATSYVDSTVQAGITYSYYVESVAASGTQSTPSNEITLTVPTP